MKSKLLLSYLIILSDLLSAQQTLTKPNPSINKQISSQAKVNQFHISDTTLIFNNSQKVDDYEKEEEELHHRKKLWIEKAHRAAPGTNWREIETKNMLNNYHQNLSLNKSQLNNQAVNSYANGSLCGTWSERGSLNLSGRCRGIDYNGSDNSLYTIGDGGILFQGLPNSSSWTILNDQFSVNPNFIKVVKNSSNGKRIIVNAGLDVFYSDNNGATFNPSSGIVFPFAWGGNYVHQIVSLSDTGTLYVVTRPWDNIAWDTRFWLYSSTDHGQTWTKIYTFPYGGNDNHLRIWVPNDQQSMAFILFNENPSTTSTLYSIVGNSVNVVNTSTDLPTNVNMLFSGNKTGALTTLYAVISGNTLYRSFDLGSSWTNIGALPESSISVLSVSPTNSSKVFIGGMEAYSSSDFGASWTLINPWTSYYGSPSDKLHADIMNIQFYKRTDGTEFSIINCDGGCYRSDDELQTVTNIGLTGLNISQYYSVVSDLQTNLFLGSQDQGFQRTPSSFTNPGILSCVQVISGDYGKMQLTRNDQSLWTEYPGGSIDNYYNSMGPITASWNMTGSTLPVYGWLLATAPVYPQNLNQIYIAGGNLSGGSGSYLIKLTATSSAISATQVNYDFRGSSNEGISAIGTTPIDINRIYVAKEDGSFFYSGDAGSTWNQTGSFTGPGPYYHFGNCIYASHKTNNLVWLGGSGYSNPAVYKSTDGGASFTAMSNGLPSTLVFGFAANADESFLYAATEAGPYVFSTFDNTWYPLSGGIAPAQTYWSVNYDTIHDIAHFATYGRGIWDFDVCSSTEVTSLNVKNGVNIYPNPFTLQTTITFNEEQKNTTIKIMDVLGKEIKTIKFKGKQLVLEKGEMKAGVYFVQIMDEKKNLESRKIVLK